MARLLNFLSAALRKKTRNTSKSFIESLPGELLTEILALVASASVTDLSSAKLSCREFFRAGNDGYVFEHASLDKFPIAWPVNDKAAYLFLKRCKKGGNPEYLYRQGMFEYFSLCCTNSGLQLLKKAAGKKHAEAIYVYSIILLCSGDQFKQQGSELLSSLTISRIRECRKNIRRVIGKMWIRNRNIVVQEDNSNSNPKTCNCWSPRNRGWGDEDEIIGCRESCLRVGESDKNFDSPFSQAITSSRVVHALNEKAEEYYKLDHGDIPTRTSSGKKNAESINVYNSVALWRSLQATGLRARVFFNEPGILECRKSNKS